MNKREQYWYTRGRKDGLQGNAVLKFDNSPDHWEPCELIEARTAYDHGLDAGIADSEQYAWLREEIREGESLEAWTIDPTRAREILVVLREDLVEFENLIPAGVLA